jgi:hypothetical protein
MEDAPDPQSTASARELFVYYKAAVADAPAVMMRVRSMHERLRGHCPGLTARLLRRPGSVDGLHTWMEIYAVDAGSLPEGIGPLLQATIESEAAVLRPHLAGPRHVEAFMPCAW